MLPLSFKLFTFMSPGTFKTVWLENLVCKLLWFQDHKECISCFLSNPPSYWQEEQNPGIFSSTLESLCLIWSPSPWHTHLTGINIILWSCLFLLCEDLVGRASRLRYTQKNWELLSAKASGTLGLGRFLIIPVNDVWVMMTMLNNVHLSPQVRIYPCQGSTNKRLNFII